MEYFKKWKEVMFNPQKFFAGAKENGFKEAYIFMLITAGIYLAISGIIQFITSVIGGNALLGVGIIIGTLVLGLIAVAIGFFIGAGIIHLSVLVFGGKQGFEETAKAVGYAYAPQIFSFIPIINIAAGIYGVILQIIGISERQKVSTGRAVAIVLVPIAIMFLILITIGIIFMGSFLGLMAGGF